MQKASPSPATDSWRPNAFWLFVAGFVLVVAVATNLFEIRYSYVTQENAGSWGMSFRDEFSDAVVLSVETGSAAAEQGVQPGDVLRPPDRFTLRINPLPGEEHHFTRIAPLPETSVTIVTTPAAEPLMAVPDLTNRIVDDTVRLLLLFGAIFVIWRGWGLRSNYMLGLGLATLAPFPPVWLPFGPGEAFAWNLATDAVFYFGTYLMVLFAMAFVAEAGVRLPNWAKSLMGLGLIQAVASYSLEYLAVPGAFPDWIYALRSSTEPLAVIYPYGLSFAVLWFGLLHADPANRHRMTLLLLALVAISIGNMLFGVINIFYSTESDPAIATAVSSGTRLLGLFLFTYAVLRHRVIDVGFAVNRTLVYGAAAFTLLVVFGLVEYIAKSMIPVAWPTAGPFISAGIAVLLFLSFHRLHHWFEHHIERLFFHHWHAAEAALRRFVESAGHFDKSQALCTATAETISRFADGAKAALYLRDNEGAYRLEAGGIPGSAPSYADDDPAFALMRSERRPLELASVNSSLSGELALPMLEQGRMAGFILLEAKPDGTRYRPDEKDLLDWAAHEVGFDLRALHARQLEEQVRSLERQVSSISLERDRLLGRLSQQA